MPQRDNGRDRDPLIRPSLFELGQVVATAGALQSIPPSEIQRALRRHAGGDWGDLDPEDARANADALQHGARLLSAYKTESGVAFWIITEADRSATTVLLPSEC